MRKPKTAARRSRSALKCVHRPPAVRELELAIAAALGIDRMIADEIRDIGDGVELGAEEFPGGGLAITPEHGAIRQLGTPDAAEAGIPA